MPENVIYFIGVLFMLQQDSSKGESSVRNTPPRKKCTAGKLTVASGTGAMGIDDLSVDALRYAYSDVVKTRMFL